MQTQVVGVSAIILYALVTATTRNMRVSAEAFAGMLSGRELFDTTPAADHRPGGIVDAVKAGAGRWC